MKIAICGSGREVGRSAILISSEKNILLDCGIKIRDEELGVAGFPKIQTNIDAIVLSHAHLDHSGFTPAIFNKYRCPIYSTIVTESLSDLLVRDAKKIDPSLPFSIQEIEETIRGFVNLPYGLEHDIGGTKLTLHDAGHIPGSAITELKTNGKKIVYTSDFKFQETRLQKQADAVEDVDVLITESTYSYKDHPNRKETEKAMLKRIQETISEGGNVIMPTFAVGRTQEIALILYSYDVELPVFLDGMGRAASEIIVNYQRYVKNPMVLREALRNLQPVGRDKAVPLSKPSIIVATAGMLEGGPAIWYILAANKREDKKADVFFTGYCLEETNGWYLQNKSMIYLKKTLTKKAKPVNINLPNHLFHLSAHADKSDILNYIKKANPEKIICVHGDHCEEFSNELKQQGFDAAAPKNGEIINI